MAEISREEFVELYEKKNPRQSGIYADDAFDIIEDVGECVLLDREGWLKIQEHIKKFPYEPCMDLDVPTDCQKELRDWYVELVRLLK